MNFENLSASEANLFIFHLINYPSRITTNLPRAKTFPFIRLNFPIFGILIRYFFVLSTVSKTCSNVSQHSSLSLSLSLDKYICWSFSLSLNNPPEAHDKRYPLIEIFLVSKLYPEIRLCCCDQQFIYTIQKKGLSIFLFDIVFGIFGLIWSYTFGMK